MNEFDKEFMAICKHLIPIKDNIPSEYEYKRTDGVTFYSCKKCIKELKKGIITNFATVCRGKCII